MRRGVPLAGPTGPSTVAVDPEGPAPGRRAILPATYPHDSSPPEKMEKSADGAGRSRLLSSLTTKLPGDALEKVLARLGKLKTAKEYKLALQACCHAKQWQTTLALFAELEASELQPDVACFNAVMRACQSTGQMEQVRWCVTRMKAHGVRPDSLILQVANRSFSMAISAHEKAGRWSQALSLLSEMTDACVTPDVVTFNAAVSACHKGGQWERAVSLLDQMRDAGVSPDAITYNAAISTCGKGGKWERALSLLEEMRGAGVAATVISFNAAASACEKAGKWERAVLLLEDMRSAGIDPDVRTYNAAISACGKGGQWQQSLLLLRQMDGTGVRPHAISSLLAIFTALPCSSLPCPCVPTRDLSSTRASNTPSPQVHPDTISFCNAIGACGKSHEWVRAQALLAEMRTRGVETGVEGLRAVSYHRPAPKIGTHARMHPDPPSHPRDAPWPTVRLSCAADGRPCKRWWTRRPSMPPSHSWRRARRRSAAIASTMSCSARVALRTILERQNCRRRSFAWG